MKPKTTINSSNSTETTTNSNTINHEHLTDDSHQEGPAWLLAWFLCGGVGSAERIREVRSDISLATGELTSAKASDEPGASRETGDSALVSPPVRRGDAARNALRRAGQAGQVGLVKWDGRWSGQRCGIMYSLLGGGGCVSNLARYFCSCRVRTRVLFRAKPVAVVSPWEHLGYCLHLDIFLCSVAKFLPQRVPLTFPLAKWTLLFLFCPI